MKIYTFIYFGRLVGDERYNSHEFSIRCSKFTQAFSLFVEFFNSLSTVDGLKDFEYTYRVTTDKNSCYRSIPSKYWSYLHVCLSEV